MKAFQYNGMPKVYFGENALATAFSAELPGIGPRVMLAFGGGSIRKNGIYDAVVRHLDSAGKTIVPFGGIMPNPTYAKVLEGARIAREKNIDFILAVGGGSVLDCAKMISAQARMTEDIWDAEFRDHRLPAEFIPMASVLTASGTGSEVNDDAVITNEEKKIKEDMIGALPAFAVLDPAYTLSVPMMQAVSGAFDSLSHCMEIYFGKPAETNLSDEMDEAVMRNIICHIRAMIRNPGDVSVRSELMWDSTIAETGILKLGKETDFQNHMIEHQLGALTDCSHGQGLAVIHPAVYRHLVSDNTAKFVRFAREVWHLAPDGRTDTEFGLAGIHALADFIREIGLPTTLTELRANMPAGRPDPADPAILRQVADTCILRPGCARQMSREEIYEILLECIG
jgi:alcohol dehydrogenase YqhD (iron-dependent ADH family)